MTEQPGEWRADTSTVSAPVKECCPPDRNRIQQQKTVKAKRISEPEAGGAQPLTSGLWKHNSSPAAQPWPLNFSQ